MDLTGIAALCALGGIPATLVVAHWQKRSALEQAEANHRTALAQAEASHRAALEVAEASHRSSLELTETTHRQAVELARRQAEFEWAATRWEARKTVYEQYQKALDQLRRLVLSETSDLVERSEAGHVIHDFHHVLRMVAADEVFSASVRVRPYCGVLANSTSRTLQERAELWEKHVTPLRADLDNAIKRDLAEQPYPQLPPRED
ncbi:hypothetical protein [Streptomyces sp. BA2]|uniref:hypothetical protein n=1 Tax=Streptomyces sp. BA2 TaxID=436595 RepID=UPI0013217969|nr:hypothetical protein [Streptomyces sp. BA2]MWA16143.1 hypothetical protein [Streptomyces sp. BA2]